MVIFFAIMGGIIVAQQSRKSTPSKRGNEKVRWLTWNEMMAKQKVRKKKVFIDVYTDWCGWCRYMDNNVFSRPDVASVLNKYFYPVKLNAETTDTIIYNGHVLVNPAPNRPRSAHQLAYALLDGRMAYPSMVILDEEMRRLQIISGAQQPENLIQILEFFGGGHYKKMSYQEFLKTRRNGRKR